MTAEQKARAYDRIMKREKEIIEQHQALLEVPNQNKLARELQDRLVQCCLDFINEKGNTDIWRVNFTADCLQESAKYGSWQPCTDSTCELEGKDGTISFSA